jgi:membrane-associated phospholipid phosphatase
MKLNHAVTVFAHPVTIAGFAVASTLLADRKLPLATRFLVALPLGVLSSKAVKRTFPRQKPKFWSLTPRQSMPSGHAAGVMAFAGALIDGLGAWRASPLAAAGAAAIGVSRVRAREHRVVEVLVGNAIGLAAAVIAGVVARKLLNEAA